MSEQHEENPRGVIPYLTVSSAQKAIDFYKQAFGGEEVRRMPAPDGRVMHAQVRINGGMLYLSDDFPEMAGGKSRTPEAIGGCPATLHINVDDTDATVERARRAGAKVVAEPADMFWGDRFAKITDPMGYSWSITAPLKQPMSQEAQKAQLAAFGQG